MNLFNVENIKFPPDYKSESIEIYLKKLYAFKEPFKFTIVRRSLDARDKNDIHYNLKLLIELSDNDTHIAEKINLKKIESEKNYVVSYKKNSVKIAVIGSGPAGLFCALRLIEYGIKVIIIERGKQVDERLAEIKNFERQGILNSECNVVFGEGGAGLYSDGKLTARTRAAESFWFFKQLVKFGADESILYESKPHLGSDLIRNIVKNIRKHILNSGSDIVFNKSINKIEVKNNHIESIKSESSDDYSADAYVLATGHSARDIYSMLHENNVSIETKDFAVGVRVEHSSELIKKIQYGKSRYKDILPAAEYFLKHNNSKTGRGIYSFCMCPGGLVINSSSEEKHLCVNGMSYSKRSGAYSNSAIVVTVSKNDFPGNPLSGLEFQRNIEHRAFLAGGGGFSAPAINISDFISGKKTGLIPANSFMPGVVSADFSNIFPEWIIFELKNAIIEFEKKMKGFITSEAVLIAPETRTSSPVRIIRDENRSSPSLHNLYPAGEGSGYSGGIVSSAVDGIRTADSIAERFLNQI